MKPNPFTTDRLPDFTRTLAEVTNRRVSAKIKFPKDLENKEFAAMTSAEQKRWQKWSLAYWNARANKDFEYGRSEVEQPSVEWIKKWEAAQLSRVGKAYRENIKKDPNFYTRGAQARDYDGEIFRDALKKGYWGGGTSM